MPKISFIDHIRRIVGGDSLSATYYQFLLVHTEFMIFSALPGVFINTFLMKQTGSMNVVLIFNCLSFSGTAIGMLFSSAAVHRFHAGVVSVLGVIGYNLLYLQLILFNSHAADFVVLLGITSGLAGAFYWISYSERLTQYTNLSNRDSGMAIISMISSAINLVVPFFAGAVISAVGGDTGYNVVFGIAFVIAIVTAVGAMRLPKSKDKTPRVRHTQSFRFSFRHKALLYSLLSAGFMGIREGAFGFILSILLYRLVNSEVLVGFNTLLSSAAAIASFLIISRKIKGKNRVQYMKIAVSSLLIFSIFAVFKINPIIIILFTIVNSFFSGFISNSAFGIFLDIIQTVPGAESMRPELFAQ
ncbi:MAG: hypothetical protein K0Q85_835, partial [Caproiciproducens sp.]|nr:hypothetical protein [Caproiciproducens sp.]